MSLTTHHFQSFPPRSLGRLILTLEAQRHQHLEKFGVLEGGYTSDTRHLKKIREKEEQEG